MKKSILAMMTAAAVVLAACGGSGASTSGSDAGSTKAAADSSEKSSEEGGSGSEAAGGKRHIDVIAKGFQHQFWKAVEQGSKKAAEEFNVDVTFQGPDTESNIAQQIEYAQFHH